MQFPDNLTQHAEPNLGVTSMQAETTDEAADFCIRERCGTGVEIAARPQSFQKDRCDAFDFSRGSNLLFRRLRGTSGVSGQFVQAHRYRLPKVH